MYEEVFYIVQFVLKYSVLLQFPFLLREVIAWIDDY
jgi:hypothetical protein